MRTYRITRPPMGVNEMTETVQADAVMINMNSAVFLRNVEMGASEYGMATQPRLVLALAAGEWTRIEEVQE